jgi:NADH pyrophosphatase NudC (nudix superfamily)
MNKEEAIRILRGDVLGTNEQTHEAVFMAIKALKAEPKRGKWEMRPDPYGYFDLMPVCTACGCSNKWREKYSFCPNCGADMRERSEE